MVSNGQSMVFSLKIPQDRVAVLIGTDGETLQKLKKASGCDLEVESETGEVTIHDESSTNTYNSFRMRDVIKAIARGFTPEKSLSLLEDDMYYEELDIRDFTGKSSQRVQEVRARVIGSKGKTRRLVEELTGCHLSIKGNTVGMIGDLEGLKIAHKAVSMVLQGSEHSTVYSFLERKQKDLKMARYGF